MRCYGLIATSVFCFCFNVCVCARVCMRVCVIVFVRVCMRVGFKSHSFYLFLSTVEPQ